MDSLKSNESIMESKMKKFALLSVLLAFALPSFSKSGLAGKSVWGDCHSRDQMLVLGLYSEKKRDETEQNFNKIGYLLSKFNYLIDDYKGGGENSEFYNKLKSKYNKYDFVNFSYHNYTHRIMFHWGYDYRDPMGHNALEGAFFNSEKINLRKLTSEQKKVYKSFLKDIIQEQGRREKIMTGEVEKFFNVNNKFHHSIGSLIYYTHLLGDHMEHANSYTEEAVLSIPQIFSRIKSAVDDIPNESKSKKEREYFKKEWRELENSNKTGNALATRAMKVLQTTLPPILEKSFEDTFKKAGLTFVYK